MPETGMLDEWFWGGYLGHLIQTGKVTAKTPWAEVARMKAEFMDGLQPLATPPTDTPKEQGNE